MSSLNHVAVLGTLFSEYWRHLEETMSSAALGEWMSPTVSSNADASSSPNPLTTKRLPPLNWSCLAAEFYAKTDMLLLPEHLVDCYLVILEEKCGGHVKELHRLFGSSPGGTRGTHATASRAAVSSNTEAGRRAPASAHGTASLSSTAGRASLADGSGTPPHGDAARDLLADGDPMSPLGRRDAGSSFSMRSGGTEAHDKAPQGGESGASHSGGQNDLASNGAVGGDSGQLTVETSDDFTGLFRCSTPAWVSGLSSEQQQRLQRLRHETPLSPEILAQLLEQLSLVEGAPLFMNAVQPQTMMVYNGVSAGPYTQIIYKPMSLATMKANVVESRRKYHLRTTVAANTEGDADTDDRRGVKRARGGGPVESSGSGAGPAVGATGNVGEAATATEMALSENSSLSRVLTLADVERAVWQTAANCAMFNAPESDYPFSARRFAIGCMKVLEEYCHQQLLGA